MCEAAPWSPWSADVMVAAYCALLTAPPATSTLTTACKVERKGGEEHVAKATYLLAYIFVFKIHLFEITGHNDKDNLCCVDD